MKSLVRKNAEVELIIYGIDKYGCGAVTDLEKVEGTRYTYPKGKVASWEVKQFSDEEIYSMGFDEVDPLQEYLILNFEDGDTSTFRNSFVDMFII